MNTEPLRCPECGGVVFVEERVSTTTTEKYIHVVDAADVAGYMDNRVHIATYVDEGLPRYSVQCGCYASPFIIDAGVLRKRDV